MGSIAEDAIKKNRKHSPEPSSQGGYGGPSQGGYGGPYGGPPSHGKGNDMMDQLGNYFKK